MPGGYSKVYSRMWSDPRFRAWTEDARHAALYVLTCPHRNTEGLFRLPLPLAAYDLQWTTARTAAAFGELEEARWMVLDPDTDLVWIIDAVADDPPVGPKRTKGAVNKLADTPTSVLRGRYVGHCRRVFPALADAIVAQLGWPEYPSDTVSEPYRGGSDTPSIPHSHSQPHTQPHPQPADTVPEPLGGAADDPVVVGLADQATQRATLDPSALADERTRELVAEALTLGLTPAAVLSAGSDAAANDPKHPRPYLRAILTRMVTEPLVRPAATVTAFAAHGHRRGALDDERAPCARCNGFGVVDHPDGGMVQCPDCTSPGPRRARAALTNTRTPHPDHDTEHP